MLTTSQWVGQSLVIYFPWSRQVRVSPNYNTSPPPSTAPKKVKSIGWWRTCSFSDGPPERFHLLLFASLQNPKSNFPLGPGLQSGKTARPTFLWSLQSLHYTHYFTRNRSSGGGWQCLSKRQCGRGLVGKNGGVKWIWKCHFTVEATTTDFISGSGGNFDNLINKQFNGNFQAVLFCMAINMLANTIG